MSFRELRNFTEIMRALGYPRLISVENFRTPNFQLVADALYWLTLKYDPSISVSDEIDSEDDRVTFLTSIARVMMSKARIKLNTKRLYAADGRAVKELLKVASMLYAAANIDSSAAGEGDDGDTMPLSAKFRDLKSARALAREITDRGARLHDLLQQEPQLREARLRALRFLESGTGAGADSAAEASFVERSIRDIIASVHENVQSLEKQCAELESSERGLDSKIKRKQADLERSEKRLKSLQSVRPAFMDEYEKLEEELQRQYDIYLERFRNLDYLEHELDQTREVERATISRSEKTIQRRKDRETKRQLHELRGEDDFPDDRRRGSDDMGSRGNSRGGSGGSRGGGGGGGGSRGGGGGGDKPRQQGSLMGPGRGSGSDSDTLSDSTGSGSDLESDEEVSLGGSSRSGSGSFRSDGSDLVDGSDSDSDHSDF